jgi:hypothetical protein
MPLDLLKKIRKVNKLAGIARAGKKGGVKGAVKRGALSTGLEVFEKKMDDFLGPRSRTGARLPKGAIDLNRGGSVTKKKAAVKLKGRK